MKILTLVKNNSIEISSDTSYLFINKAFHLRFELRLPDNRRKRQQEKCPQKKHTSFLEQWAHKRFLWKMKTNPYFIRSTASIFCHSFRFILPSSLLLLFKGWTSSHNRVSFWVVVLIFPMRNDGCNFIRFFHYSWNSICFHSRVFFFACQLWNLMFSRVFTTKIYCFLRSITNGSRKLKHVVGFLRLFFPYSWFWLLMELGQFHHKFQVSPLRQSVSQSE